MRRSRRSNQALLMCLIGAFSLVIASIIGALASAIMQSQPPQAKRRSRPATGRLRI